LWRIWNVYSYYFLIPCHMTCHSHVVWSLYLNVLLYFPWHLTPDIWYLILDIISLDTWHMLSLGTDTFDIISWHLTGFYYTWHLYYIASSWLSLLRGLDMILYCYQTSDTPELLYSWTPKIWRLLILYSWYYTPIAPRNWIIMDIVLLWIHCGHHHWTIYNKVLKLHRDRKTDGYRYSFSVYGGHTNVVQLILEILPGGH